MDYLKKFEEFYYKYEPYFNTAIIILLFWNIIK